MRFLFLLLFINPVIHVDTKLGCNVRHFTTKPGSKGKPNTVVYTVKGIVPVYEIFDWKKIDPKLKGNHTWYRVCSSNSYWIYHNTNFRIIE